MQSWTLSEQAHEQLISTWAQLAGEIHISHFAALPQNTGGNKNLFFYPNLHSKQELCMQKTCACDGNCTETLRGFYLMLKLTKYTYCFQHKAILP